MIAYALPQTTDQSYHRWHDPGVLTPDMAALMTLVATALDAGIFYEDALDAAVVPQLALTADERARGRQEVHGGVIGYEIYHARHRVEAERDAAAERTARAQLQPVVGMKLGTLTLGAGWIGRRAVIHAVHQGTLDVHYTRGNHRYGQHLTAREVLAALATKGTTHGH